MQSKLNKFGIDERLVQEVNKIIEAGSSIVSKPVRAGFTTSVIYACEQESKKLLILAPTKRILRETVSGAASEGLIIIPGNSECPEIMIQTREHPILKQLPISLPNCKKCKAFEKCHVTDIVRRDDAKTIGLTYAKLESIMLSKNPTTSVILNKLTKMDAVLLDETHILSLPSETKVRAFTTLDMLPDKYRSLNKIYTSWKDLCASNISSIEDMKSKGEQGHVGLHLSKSITNPKNLTWNQLIRAWGQLRTIATNQQIPDAEILKLKDIITLMSSANLSLSFISEEEGDMGSVYVSTGKARLQQALKEFLTTCMGSATHVFVSGTMFEFYTGFLSEMSGQSLKQVVFPDIRDATRMLTLIPDTWKLTSRNFSDNVPEIVETVKAIQKIDKQPIYLLAPNSRKATDIKDRLDAEGVRDITVDYYRSDKSIGVERSERICIAVGLAETPANSCDCLVTGNNQEERWLRSRSLRMQGVDAASWQAVNRVRDPSGLVPSKIYFIGVRQERVQQVAKWGTNRMLDLLDIKKTKGSKGEEIRTPIFEVKVDQPIELPNIAMENKNKSNPERRTAKDFIGEIELFGEDSTKLENDCKCSIYIYRDNAVKLEFYNRPSSDSEVESTATLLMAMFMSRPDCYARQDENGYKLVKESPNIDLIKSHVAGKITIGAYNINKDDQVNWCCIDLDSHNGETDTKDRVRRVIDTLRKHKIPFMLESSGSPDSYHVWIFLAKTRTLNAFKFVRKVVSEADVKNYEAFPKQKKLENGKYGNLVKLPICVNKRSGNRSMFLDPDTFEPLEGAIHVAGIVHLLEVPEPAKCSMPKVRKYAKMTSGMGIAPTELNYCMSRLLSDNVPLTGSEGHEMRLAIAVMAKHLVMTAEDTVNLFQHQSDFNYDFSLTKVLETWKYDYHPYSCETLQDKCGGLVQGYCITCPRIDGKATSSETSMAEVVSQAISMKNQAISVMPFNIGNMLSHMLQPELNALGLGETSADASNESPLLRAFTRRLSMGYTLEMAQS